MTELPSPQYWTVWYPKAAATGLLLGRGRLDAADQLLVHAAPDFITVEITDDDGQRLAFGQDLAQTLDLPMCRLRRRGGAIVREDIWPDQHDLGSLVLLPGGEVGVLKHWWHAADQQSWRWQVEFYNNRRGEGKKGLTMPDNLTTKILRAHLVGGDMTPGTEMAVDDRPDPAAGRHRHHGVAPVRGARPRPRRRVRWRYSTWITT